MAELVRGTLVCNGGREGRHQSTMVMDTCCPSARAGLFPPAFQCNDSRLRCLAAAMPVTVVIDDSDDEEKKVAVPVNTARSAHNAAAAASTDAETEAGRKRAAPEEPEDKGAACTICLEPVESSGPHGPANLKCGHIFGKECIQ
ncbi:hypothetical protein HaLaN_30856, partial [Haematococcus lacustris]